MATTGNTVPPSPMTPEGEAQERARMLIEDVSSLFGATHWCLSPWCTFNNIRGAENCERCNATMIDSDAIVQKQILVSGVLDWMVEEAPFVHRDDTDLQIACIAASHLVQEREQDPLGFWGIYIPEDIFDILFRGVLFL
ncbi:hypothetical protein CEP52_013421 [Fusarium oligoseptatum]|uniref:Uncharacterized protein n=1 Tax=Fusarium oligoseptatum TaxID=2604345 RepID=A0A428STN1_9HYPO|nr:hypothetical protein CEP52_013421 [Fusarium oligoseptatum]